MKRLVFCLGLILMLGLPAFAGPAWANHGFHGGFRGGIPAGHGHGFHGHGHAFRPHPFFFQHHHRFVPLAFPPFVIVRPAPAPAWVAGGWHWDGFRWVWVPAQPIW